MGFLQDLNMSPDLCWAAAGDEFLELRRDPFLVDGRWGLSQRDTMGGFLK